VALQEWKNMFLPLMSETRLGLLIYLIIWGKRMENFEEILRKDLHQLYLFGAAMQLKRMGYHMTKM